ncbi:lysophospholipid acyltransferase family protein [Paludibacter jiangxiensis]|uniref:Putative hemolysin n=1 Tax=Paludibacter jiangxiensis TaxID=681398 RepID=A0A170ZWD8_9BACT|nr:lysophospholipid acyltransferase family protein [Paludibacter jiangxiensis]GAT63076.1 putative hemolysin [Paludibacter jiangxiensis]
MKRTVIDVEFLAKKSLFFRGRLGRWLGKVVLHLLAIDRINWAYGRSCDHTGAAFAEGLLKDFGVDYRVGNAERLRHLPEGPFITVSNHPYGGLDGIMLIHLMAGIRPDYKVMVNQILTLIEAMDENFISVQPRIGHNTTPSAAAINGMRETLHHLRDGHPVGCFPAGAVSMFSCKTLRVRDRQWQEGILKLIQVAKVPVLPIRFYDKNSIFFYFLGLIDWRIRSLRMPYELFNKKGQRPRIGIGELITAEEIKQFKDAKALGDFLRNKVYDMPLPTTFTPKTKLDVQDKTV